jgi:hypothetical protein
MGKIVPKVSAKTNAIRVSPKSKKLQVFMSGHAVRRKCVVTLPKLKCQDKEV